VFKVSAFRLDRRAQTGAPLSDCRINNTPVKFTVTSHWERRYTVNAVHMVDISGTTSRSTISCLGPEIFVQINRILTKLRLRKLGVPVIMTHSVVWLMDASKMTDDAWLMCGCESNGSVLTLTCVCRLSAEGDAEDSLFQVDAERTAPSHPRACGVVRMSDGELRRRAEQERRCYCRAVGAASILL